VHKNLEARRESLPGIRDTGWVVRDQGRESRAGGRLAEVLETEGGRITKR
jgi:hypothetical protein